MARKASSAPNLAVIAKKLGISRATASRAIRDADGIHIETRDLVLKTAQELGYVIPQRRKSTDELQRHHVMVLSQTTQASDWNYLTGMSRASIPLRLMLLVHHVTGDDVQKIVERQHQPTAMQEDMVDGLVFLRRWPSEIVEKLSAKTPAVSVVHHYAGSNTDFVGIDDRTGMKLIVAHLIRAGCKKIGFFGLCVEMSWSRSRYYGFLEAMATAGQPCKPGNVVEIDLNEILRPEGPMSEKWAEEALAKTRAGVDAWVCASHGLGWQLSRFFLARGVRIPDDVAVTGYHRNAPDPADLPPLTTTEVSDEELGAAALRMLVHRFEYPRNATQSLLLAPTLLARASTPPERR